MESHTNNGVGGLSKESTFGEKAVGLTFDPSNNPRVHAIKVQYAQIIDTLDALRTKAEEEKRVEAIKYFTFAIVEAQTAQMWAVKAITCTWKD